MADMPSLTPTKLLSDPDTVHKLIANIDANENWPTMTTVVCQTYNPTSNSASHLVFEA